jgi:hypothetical protein
LPCPGRLAGDLKPSCADIPYESQPALVCLRGNQAAYTVSLVPSHAFEVVR